MEDLQLIEFRQTLHQFPELSCFEKETAKRVIDFNKAFQPDEIIENLGGTGVAVIYNGKNDGPTLLFRCELDALPIQEINTMKYKSVTDGVSHKCGHDGHMAILSGFSKMLSQNRPDKGRVVLLFQPAEENGEGAKAILADERFEWIKPDFVYALHNVPGFPMGQILYKKGAFTPAVISIAIILKGKTAHAAEPEQGINPAVAISKIIQAAKEIENTDINATNFNLITPIQITMGEESYGISAGYGEVKLTIRCWENDQLPLIMASLLEKVKEIAEEEKIELETNWLQQFMSNFNADCCVDMIEKAASTGGFDHVKIEKPFRWGEDFGLFTERFTGAMFAIGAGEKTPALHNPDYDFPDQLISIGVLMFHEVMKQTLVTDR